MVYAAACDGLDPDARGELDAALEVAAWPAAGQTPGQAEARAGVPSWWHGEEEASQSFLRGLGLRLDGGDEQR